MKIPIYMRATLIQIFLVLLLIIMGTTILTKTYIDKNPTPEEQNGFYRDLAFISAVALIIISGATYMTTGGIIRPIRELKETIEEISKGRFDVHINPELLGRDDEIGELANAFDRTAISLKLAVKKVGLTREELQLGNLLKEKEESEKKLRESNEFVEEILQQGGVPIVAFNKDGVLMITNKAFLETTGYKKEDVETRDAWLKKCFPAKMAREKIDKAIKEAYEGKEVKDFVIPILCKDNSTVVSVANIGHILDEKTTIVGEVYFLRDLSEIFHLEEQLRHWAANGFVQTARKSGKVVTVNKKNIEISDSKQKDKKR
ncbi:MAG TPA: HAMP domain-containing protein [Candidatus Nanoarchaeia archaeon]|nr:HAMP domain-containing protein [Candidatus Nanoarchaeia archaeon]